MQWLQSLSNVRHVLQIGHLDLQKTYEMFPDAMITCIHEGAVTDNSNTNNGKIEFITTKNAVELFDTHITNLTKHHTSFDVVLAHELQSLASMMQCVVLCPDVLSSEGVLSIATKTDWVTSLKSVTSKKLQPFINIYDVYFVINCSRQIQERVHFPLLTVRPAICVGGMQGLGNTLYQVASAIDYCERVPNSQILLLDGPSFFTGSANYEGRQQALTDGDGKMVPYKATIFSKFAFVTQFPNPRQSFEQDYGPDHIQWDPERTHLEIKSWQQHVNLFRRSMHVWDKYFNFKHIGMMRHLLNRYAYNQTQPIKWFNNCVCIGIRRGQDFRHKTAITNKILNRIHREYYPNRHALIIGDVNDTTNHLVSNDEELNFPFTVINEPDVVQLNIAFLCNALIVSESTFHAWIGYIMNTHFSQTSDITCFNNTDLTQRNLTLPSWRHVDL